MAVTISPYILQPAKDHINTAAPRYLPARHLVLLFFPSLLDRICRSSVKRFALALRSAAIGTDGHHLLVNTKRHFMRGEALQGMNFRF